MFALIDPRIWIVFALSLMAAFTGGYGYHAYRTQIEQATQTATVQTVTKTIKVTDQAQVSTLQAKLSAAQDKATALESLINEARNASPTPPSVDCRIPDRVRNALNADLADGAQ